MKADTNENPSEVPMDMKAHVPGTMTIILENGDVIVVQSIAQAVRLRLGEKDKDGKRVYNIDWTNGMSVFEGK